MIVAHRIVARCEHHDLGLRHDSTGLVRLTGRTGIHRQVSNEEVDHLEQDERVEDERQAKEEAGRRHAGGTRQEKRNSEVRQRAAIQHAVHVEESSTRDRCSPQTMAARAPERDHDGICIGTLLPLEMWMESADLGDRLHPVGGDGAQQARLHAEDLTMEGGGPRLDTARFASPLCSAAAAAAAPPGTALCSVRSCSLASLGTVMHCRGGWRRGCELAARGAPPLTGQLLSGSCSSTLCVHP